MKETRLKGEWIYSYETLEKINFGEQEQINSFLGLMEAGRLIGKGHKETFWDDEYVLYFDCVSDFLIMNKQPCAA